MNEKGMNMLASKERIPYLYTVKIDLCESCVMGKQKNVVFTNIGHPPKSRKLELVHSYVYGPTLVSSAGRS